MEKEGEIVLECLACRNRSIADEKKWDEGVTFLCAHCGESRLSKVFKYLVVAKDAFKDMPVEVLVFEIKRRSVKVHGFDSEKGYLEHPVTVALRDVPPRIEKEE